MWDTRWGPTIRTNDTEVDLLNTYLLTWKVQISKSIKNVSQYGMVNNAVTVMPRIPGLKIYEKIIESSLLELL